MSPDEAFVDRKSREAEEAGIEVEEADQDDSYLTEESDD